MKGVNKAAQRANGASRMCCSCLFKMKDHRICALCISAFDEGFKKGVRWVEEQLKTTDKQ